MNSPLYEFPIRSFHFRKDEIQELVSTLDMMVEGYDSFNTENNRLFDRDLQASIQKLVANVISRKQEYEGISRQQEF